MRVNNRGRKFIGEIVEEDMLVIEQAAKIRRAPRLSIIRKGAVEYAKRILEEEEKKEDDTIQTND